jgi:predicted nucleotidyltransferase
MQTERATVTLDPALNEVVQRLTAELHPSYIYLFGSRARGDWNDQSDYDLMVLVDYPASHPYRLGPAGLRSHQRSPRAS